LFLCHSEGMKNRFAHLLICLGAILNAPLAYAQVAQIPGSLDARLSGYCQSIQNQNSSLGSIGDFRIKRGGHVTLTGVRQTVYIEDGGSADIRGSASLVYVARGGKATVSGERNTVYAERGGNIVTVGKVTMNVVEAIQLHPHQNGTSCQ
jgi:hypothetical protein